jgi:hypothetical protein
MRRFIAVGSAATIGALVIAGCGSSGGTTTVIREKQPTTIEKTTTVQAPAPKPKHVSHASSPASESEPEPQSPPNVVGLPLPAGEHLLKEAGYKAAVSNTDTSFGIVIPSHFTICEQSDPRGDLVPILAQKYGC